MLVAANIQSNILLTELTAWMQTVKRRKQSFCTSWRKELIEDSGRYLSYRGAETLGRVLNSFDVGPHIVMTV